MRQLGAGARVFVLEWGVTCGWGSGDGAESPASLCGVIAEDGCHLSHSFADYRLRLLLHAGVDRRTSDGTPPEPSRSEPASYDEHAASSPARTEPVIWYTDGTPGWRVSGEAHGAM